MSNLYPPLVDQRNPTIGELPKYPPLVNYLVMTDRPDYSAIGDRLMKIRLAFSDLNQKEWAERHNFGSTQYNNWENGTRRISVDAADILVDRYSLTLDYIFRGNVSGLKEKDRKVL